MSESRPQSEYGEHLVEEVLAGSMTRAQLMRRAAAAGLSLSALGALLPEVAQSAATADAFKVGFIYVGPIGDAGWTFQHNLGRKFVEARVPNVKTTFIESVPEANAGPALDQLISQGHKLIFATSFGFGDAVVQRAQQHPDVLFEHATGFQRAKNVTTYFVKHWEPSYLLGVIAGHLTKNGKLGYVGGFAIPEIIRDVNSYVLGAQSVNPKVTLKIIFLNTFFDPPKEKQAAKSLIDAGVDVLYGDEDSPSVLQEAAAEGKLASTWNSNMVRFGPNAFLSALVLNWGPYYAERTRAAINGTWKSQDYWGTLRDRGDSLAPFGKSVPPAVRKDVNGRLAKVKAGTLNPWVGPIRDQKGRVRVPKGKAMSFKQIVDWDWFVQGIEGKLPKSS